MEPEDLVHFMLTCEKLKEVCQPFISKLETLITSHHGSHWWNQLGDWDMVQYQTERNQRTNEVADLGYLTWSMLCIAFQTRCDS